MSIKTAEWQVYPSENDLVGELRLLQGVWSPQLNSAKDVLVLLPPSYHTDSTRRYPVVYMQDAQNLFDPATAYGGSSWRVDMSMAVLAEEGLEALIVGVAHGGKQRIAEYNPFPGGRFPSKGEAYLSFLSNVLKPRMDRDFRTLPERDQTVIMGSSMGGLISLYAYFTRSEVFGRAGVMSPSLWMGSGAIYGLVNQAGYVPGRIYLDHGTEEPSALRMFNALRGVGYTPDTDLMYVAEEGATHTESAWGRRFPDALRFLLR